ncbi:MAG TPA: CHAD domain-containing protein [Terracidiphilus sp.]|jgi:CHAD domain-containing protein
MTEPAEYQSDASTPGAGASVLDHLRQVAEAMRVMLDACRKHGEAPKVEDVHRLRTGTRRVEAALETLAREAGARGLGKATEEARQRWLKQLKKIRRAAGTVRDFDVHRELIAESFLSAPHAAAASGKATPLIEQAHALDAWLKDRRTAAAETLASTLGDHAGLLLDAEKQFLTAISQRRSILRRAHRPASRLALEDYMRLMDAMPLLDKENLHDFRKGAKKARYVAESDDNDPGAAAMAKAVKRVQDSIGDWHDWEVVAEEAGEALGNDGAALQTELQSRAQRAYDQALRVTSTMGRRFIGEWRASRPPRERPRYVRSRPSS